jgi:hypothetical protein
MTDSGSVDDILLLNMTVLVTDSVEFFVKGETRKEKGGSPNYLGWVPAQAYTWMLTEQPSDRSPARWRTRKSNTGSTAGRNISMTEPTNMCSGHRRQLSTRFAALLSTKR